MEKEVFMLKFPMKFSVNAKSAGEDGGRWLAQENNLPPIQSAIPHEFGGPGGGYSPETLFGIAVLNCLLATFKVYCRMQNVTFQEIEGAAEVTLEKGPPLHVSNIHFTLRVRGASDKGKAESILSKATADCAISNSIKSAKTFDSVVE